MYALPIVLFSVVSAVSGQFLNCNWVYSLDCTTYAAFQECGTNGVTYDNRCYFANAQCNDVNLHINHDGKCLPSDGPTTPSPTIVNGNQAVLDFFCTSLSKQDCGPEVQEVCASDNWTYRNYCEFDKARCTHRDLQVVQFKACP